MLILTRRIGESLRIGDDVSVVVMGIQGNQVKIGIDAPKDLPVHREEIYQKIQAAKEAEANGLTPEPYQKKKEPVSAAQPEAPASSYSYDPDSQPQPGKTPNVIIKKRKITGNF